MPASHEFRKQLDGYGLTTAQIYYHYPDRPTIVNPNWLLWQHYDVFPEFPELHKYLDMWNRKIEGPLASVTVWHSRLIKPAEIRAIGNEFRLH